MLNGDFEYKSDIRIENLTPAGISSGTLTGSRFLISNDKPI